MIVISSEVAFKDASLLSLSIEFSNSISEQCKNIGSDEEKYAKMSKDKTQYGFIDRFIFKSKRNYYKRKRNRLEKIEWLVFALDGISKDCFPFLNNDLASIMELLSLLPLDEARQLRDVINKSLSSNKNLNKQRLQSSIKKIRRALKKTRIAKKYYKSSFGLVTFEYGINKIDMKAKEVLKSPISIFGLEHALSSKDDTFF